MSVVRQLAVATTVVAWVPPVVFGRRWAAYDAARDFISELGAAGAPDAAAVNASFLVAGMLFVATCAAIARQHSGGRAVAVMALVSLVGWSYVVAAFAPCDSGCPADGSPTQTLHNSVGGLSYFACAVGLLLASVTRSAMPRAPAWLTAVAGGVALVSLVGMGAPEMAAVRGALQRLGEAAIFTWLVVEAFAVNRARETVGVAAATAGSQP